MFAGFSGDRLASAGEERKMERLSRWAFLAQAERAELDQLRGFRREREPERLENRLVEAPARLEVADAQVDVVEHGPRGYAAAGCCSRR